MAVKPVAGRKILVTGGTGFIGSAITRRLVHMGAEVRVLDNDSRGSSERLNDIQGQFELFIGDIRDPQITLNAAAGVEAVLHLAYVNGTEFFYSKPELVLDVGIRGMLNVVDACRTHGIQDLILASSSEVYQNAEHIPTDESVPLIVPDILNPRYSYGGGKILSELIAINYGRTGFDRVVIFRPHNVYGPNMGYEHVIPQFSLRMQERIKEQPVGVIDFPIQGAGTETRSFIYIDDFTDGLVNVIESGAHLNVYHIGTMDEVSIRDVAHEVAASFQREITIVPGQLTQGSTPRRCPETGKLKQLGFAPKVTLKDGVARTTAWYRDHPRSTPAR